MSKRIIRIDIETDVDLSVDSQVFVDLLAAELLLAKITVVYDSLGDPNFNQEPNVPTTYKIVRFYQDDNLPPATIVRGLTREQAEAHCKRDDTHGGDFDKGTSWFDGHEQEREQS